MFVQAAVERGLTERFDIVVVGQEPRPAYDRVALTSFFSAASADELSLLPEGRYDDPRVHSRSAPPWRRSTATPGRSPSTAARPWGTTCWCSPPGRAVRPAGPGHDLDGCFVYRTIEDLEAIRDGGDREGRRGHRRRPARARAANALVSLGLETHVVEMAPRLMPVSLDEAGGGTLVRHIRSSASRCTAAPPRSGWSTSTDTSPGSSWPTTVDAEIVVFSAGIRPRDQLARACGLPVAERGGVLVDEQCRTEDPHVFAIGECAAPGGRMYGLVAPGYSMAEVVVDTLLGGEGSFTGADMSTKLKLLGVDVASFGDAFMTARLAGGWSSPTRSPGSTRSWSSPSTTTATPRGCWAGSWSATRRRTAPCARWSSGITLPRTPRS